MRKKEYIDWEEVLSGDVNQIYLFLREGRKSCKIPVEIDAVPDRLNVYYRHELYLQIFYHLIQNLQYEYIRYDMQIIKFVYENKKLGLQFR